MDQSSPATKADIALLMEEMGKLYMHIHSSQASLKEELIERIDSSIQASETRMTDRFMLIAENLRHDLIGTHKDKISALEDTSKKHEKRLRLLEARA